MKKLYSIITLLIVSSLFAGCFSSQSTVKGLYYDPPGSTVTTDKTIELQHKRTFLFSSSDLYVSNEFEGARLNDFFQVNDTLYKAVIEPENSPINNSAWYAFKIWSHKKQKINIDLIYKNGTHRYIPKLSYDKINWVSIDSASYFPDTAKGTAMIKLNVGPDTLWISAQELLTSNSYNVWIDKLANLPFVSKKIIGYSTYKKPIYELLITESADTNKFVVLTGRQHPPEVTGALALKAFVETITGNSELAKKYRKSFTTVVIPLVNPDGVDNGHWRHNAHGVDLNRDWHSFNQPETKAVNEELLKLYRPPEKKIYFCCDFHSTQEDVFYIMSKDSTLPEDKRYEFISSWFDGIHKIVPDYKINIDASLNDPSHPTSDEWMFNKLNSPALTYEMGDETNRSLIWNIAKAASESLMNLLIKKNGE